MNDIFVKTCVVYNTEKSIDIFKNKNRECKASSIKRVLKRYYKKKDKLLQQRRDKCARLKNLDHGLKTLEEKLSVGSNLIWMT